MIRQRSGHIINTASLSGVLPTPGCVSYTAAKFGVVGLSRALRLEAAPLGVKVSVSCPVAVGTKIIDTSRYINLDRQKFIADVPGNRIDAKACAVAILRGVERNQASIEPSGAKWLILMHRHLPWLSGIMMSQFSQMVAKNRADYLTKTSRQPAPAPPLESPTGSKPETDVT